MLKLNCVAYYLLFILVFIEFCYVVVSKSFFRTNFALSYVLQCIGKFSLQIIFTPEFHAFQLDWLTTMKSRSLLIGTYSIWFPWYVILLDCMSLIPSIRSMVLLYVMVFKLQIQWTNSTNFKCHCLNIFNFKDILSLLLVWLT